MGNANCCHNAKKLDARMGDIENLKFDHLDYNRSSTYKKLEQIALEVAAQKGIPLYYNSLICRIIAHRQEHLLKVMTEISSVEERQRLLQGLEMVEFEMLDSLYFNYCVGESRKRKKSLMDQLEYESFTDATVLGDMDKEMQEQYKQEGLNLIRQRKVAVCLLAGGSNERMDGQCKFVLDIGLPSHKTLLQIMMERIARIQTIAMRPMENVWDKQLDRIPIFIICNEQNFYNIKNFFAERDYFKFPQATIQFLVQPNLPVLDSAGKIMLNGEKQVITRPAGTGSVLNVFLQGSFMNKAMNQNLQYIHFIGMENLLGYPVDPLFLGLSSLQKASVACKSIPQGDLTQLPYIIQVNEKLRVLDKKELVDLEGFQLQTHEECQQLMNDTVVDILFLQNFQKDQHKKNDFQQKYHVVERKVDGNKAFIFEKYIQDLVEVCKNPLILNVDRVRYYAPINYSTGIMMSHISTAFTERRHLTKEAGHIPDKRSIQEISQSFVSRQHSVSSSTSSVSRHGEDVREIDQPQMNRGSYQGQHTLKLIQSLNESEYWNQSTNSNNHRKQRSSLQENPVKGLDRSQSEKKLLQEGDIQSSLQQLSFVHKSWLKLQFPSAGEELLEISPLLSYQGESLNKILHVGKKKFHFPKHIC